MSRDLIDVKAGCSEKPLLSTEKSLKDIIFKIRGTNVILAPDLARLFGVETKRLNEQVKRNLKRFPNDFMFQLNKSEFAELVANCDRFSRLKHSSVLPYAFTEHGALQAANVLNSEQAIEMSVYVVRAFVAMRRMTGTLKELADKVAELEIKYGRHDEALQLLSRLLFPEPTPVVSAPPLPKRKIGFNGKRLEQGPQDAGR